MRRIALYTACFIASAVVTLLPPRASALQPAGLYKGAAFHDDSVQLVRRGFRGGGARTFRGGSVRAWRGGGTRAFRGGSVRAWRGGGARAWRGGRAHAWRGGGRRVWRGGRWVWAGAAAAPFYYGGCPLVRRTVWTPYGYRVRWVRRCY